LGLSLLSGLKNDCFFVLILNFVKILPMMYRFAASLVFISFLLLTACTGRKTGSSKAYIKPHVETANNAEPTNAYTPPSSIDKANYIIYNRELQMKMKAFNIDYRKVQVYLDQKVILSRGVDSTKAEVASGVLRYINNSIVEEITINAYTPGIIESIDDNGINIKFDNNGSIRFVPASGPDAQDSYVISGTDWNEGFCNVEYAKKVYKAQCFKCNSMGDVHPVIRQSDIDKKNKLTKVLPGIKIN
jgi:hypothetical protein